MTKQKINDLLDNLQLASEEDLTLLNKLTKQYPYSQPITILRAKVADNLNDADQKKHISKAAIFTADRNNLKQLIQENMPLPGKKEMEKRKVEEPITQNTSDRPEIPDQKSEQQQQTPATPPSRHEEQQQSPSASPSQHGEQPESSQLFKEVLENLDELKALRKKYEFLEKKEGEEDSGSKKKPEPNDQQTSTSGNIEENVPADAHQQETTNEANERNDEEQLEVNDRNDTEQTSEEDTQILNEHIEGAPDLEGKEPDTEEEEDTLGHQHQLIQSYIENEPDYVSRRQRANKIEEKNKKDLSMDSATINDELISENLAILMINQGKLDKAIDIYKKLIWKFPQKKAYFASRIEELTNQ